MIKKNFFILLVLVLSLKGQAFNPFIKIDFPDYTILEKKFQVSLILNQPDFEFTSIKINFIADKKHSLSKAVLKNQSELSSLSAEKISSYENQIVIKVDEDREILANQISLNLICESEGKLNYKFSVKYFFNDEEVYEWNSYNNFFDEERKSYFEILGKNNDYFIKFNKGANFSLNKLFDEKYNFFQFWFKIDSLTTNVFHLTNQFNDTLLFINTNKLQFLEILKEENQVDFSQVFISKNTWDKISIWFNKNENKLIFFFNNRFLTELNNIDENIIKQNGLKFQTKLPIGIDEINKSLIDNEFLKNKEKFDLENVEFNNTKKMSFKNLNEPILEFTESPYKYKKNGFVVSESNIELAVTRFDTYIELNWERNKYSKASYFLINKSIDGIKFNLLAEILALDDKEKYNYIDYFDKNQDVSYYNIVQVNIDSTENHSSIIKVGTGLTNIFEIKPNYPNPFNPITQLSVEMYESSEVQIAVYDVVGKRIATIFDGTLSQGIYTFQFDGSNYPSGLYFCEVKTPTGNQVQKMLLAK